MRESSERGGNGRADDEVEAELERLVVAEVEALAPRPETPIEDLLDQVAERLHQHPERLALLERLRAAVLGPVAEAMPVPDPDPSSGEQ